MTLHDVLMKGVRDQPAVRTCELYVGVLNESRDSLHRRPE